LFPNVALLPMLLCRFAKLNKKWKRKFLEKAEKKRRERQTIMAWAGHIDLSMLRVIFSTFERLRCAS